MPHTSWEKADIEGAIATNANNDDIEYFDPWYGKTTTKNKSKFDFNAKVKDKIHKNCVIRFK